MSIALDRLRAAQRWGRPSGARRTAGGGRRLSNAPVRVETCEIRNQSAPEVAQGYEALVGPAQARDDGRRARADAETASVGSPELHEVSRTGDPNPRYEFRPIRNELWSKIVDL